MVGMVEVGHQLVWRGGSPSGLLVRLPVLSSVCTRKSRRWLTRVVPDIVQTAIKMVAVVVVELRIKV